MISAQRLILAALFLSLLTSGCTLPVAATSWTPPQSVAQTVTLNQLLRATESSPSTPAPRKASPTPFYTPSDLPPTPSPAPSATLLPTPVFSPPPTPRTHYSLEATLDYAAHSLAVQEVITYTNTTPAEMGVLLLVVDARRYPGVFDLDYLAWADGTRIRDFYWTETQLNVLLPQALVVGENIQLHLGYTLQLFDNSKQPNVRAYPLAYNPAQTNVGDWYPYVPPYDPQTGWKVHKAWYYGENLVCDSADFDVSIRLAGSQTGLVIAASAPAHPDGEWQRYYHPAARGFTWSASPYYQVITRTVEITGSSLVTVASYFLPSYPQAGESLAETMTQALAIYSSLYGAYPRPLLSAVQAEFLDGMEYDGLFFLGSNFYAWYKDDPAQFLTMLGAHETAHQWWYALVGNDPALEPWLDEALCTYSERLYYEYAAPAALEWWWTYRINYYEPHGWVDMTIYDVANEAGHYRAYRDTVYFNGALFLEDLRQQVGDEAFFATLKEYAREYAYAQANTSDFFAILRQHTQADLEPLLQKYFKSRP
jgi:hypothetical protein